MKSCLFALLGSSVLFACGGESSSPASASTNSGPLESYFSSTAPAGAQPVLAVRSAAKPGDSVVVTGRAKDFVDGRAVFTIIDPSKPSCDEAGPMDGCPTPWDFCCDPPNEIAEASATIEFRQGSELVKQGAQGFHGLDHLDTVVVAGKLARDEAGNLTVVGERFSVAKRVPKAH